MPTNIKITIKRAMYGKKGQTIDVTKEAQDALSGDDLTISPSKLGIEDPAPGELKHFAVKAIISIDDEKPYSFFYIAEDYETIDFVP